MDLKLLQLAESGDAEAQYQLGCMYYYGEGVEQDCYKALEWFTKSADQDHPAANGMCGECYMNGEGTAQDTNKSAVYFSKGANLGDVYSQYRIGWIFWKTENYTDAIPYLEQATDAGDVDAKCLLAKSYYNGFGVPVDKVKALELFEDAAYTGYAEAQYLTSICYGFGYGTDVDLDQAYYYCKKAADQGHEEAIKNLSLFQNGLNDPEGYMAELRKLNDSDKETSNTSSKSYSSYTPSQRPRYEAPQKSDKKPGSIGILILLVLVFWPAAIWYALTHDLS